ncbi:unknown [Firmicutes bacterium CAG:791]|nr:unknown [Firmicutes bacterium CAG:791]
MHGCTGDDQIPDPGKSRKGLHLSAHGNAKPCDLRNASCNKSCLCIVSVSKTVRDAGRQCNHILQGGTNLHSKNIRTRIDAEYLTHEDILYIHSILPAAGACNNGSRHSFSDLFCMRRTAENRCAALRNFFLDDLC